VAVTPLVAGLETRCMTFFRIQAFPVIGDDPVQDGGQIHLRLEPDDGADFRDIRHAVQHVLEAFRVCFLVGDEDDVRGASDTRMDHPGQVTDGDLAGAPDVEDLAEGFVAANELRQGPDDIPDIAETSGLLAGAVDGNRFSGEGLSDEAGNHHAVAPALAGAHRVEEPDDDYREPSIPPIGHGEEFVEQFGAGIAPPRLT